MKVDENTAKKFYNPFDYITDCRSDYFNMWCKTCLKDKSGEGLYLSLYKQTP